MSRGTLNDTGEGAYTWRCRVSCKAAAWGGGCRTRCWCQNWSPLCSSQHLLSSSWRKCKRLMPKLGWELPNNSKLGVWHIYMGFASHVEIGSACGCRNFSVWGLCMAEALHNPQACKHLDLLPVKKLRKTLASPIKVSICARDWSLASRGWPFLIWEFSGDFRFSRYQICVLVQGPFWRWCWAVAMGCYEFSFLWVWTYPDICLAVTEVETREVYGEGWIWTVTNGMLTSSYKGLQLAIYFNFIAEWQRYYSFYILAFGHQRDTYFRVLCEY